MRKIFIALLVAAVAVLGDAGLAAAAGAESPSSSDGEAIIGFSRGLLPAVAVGTAFNRLDVTRVSPNGSFLTVKAPDLDAVHRALADVSGVSYVEANGVMRALATPNDTRYGEQYGPSLMGFPAAWGSVGFGNTNVTVALVDSGILKTHEDLTGPRILQGHDYVNGDADPNDNCGHGTHTAGTIGATTNNSLGVAGMVQSKILMMKALQSSFLGGCSGSFDGIAQAIMDAADQGAKVISMSIGGASSATLQNAVDYAADRGVILVAAAGNDGANNSVDFPGAYPNVIAVGALTSSKDRASYSDGGPQLDIAAPGSNVLSTYTGSNAAYSTLNGTSMATPHVAGALALALSCAPAGTTKASVVSALYSTAEDLGPAGRDDAFGYGLARADRLVQQVCNGTPPPNQAPTAKFSASPSGARGVAVNAASSSDPDGDALSYAWKFGDGTTATGVNASHTYASTGTYNITLTVKDGRGATNSRTQAFTASADPDPATPTIVSGQTVKVSVSSSAPNKYFKIAVPAGKSQINAVTTGPACDWFSCAFDADLFTRAASKPTDSTYACRSEASGNAENCTTADPASGYWYIRIKRYAGSGTVDLTVKLS
ncbi:MAG TPA: S8 family serine peptidase [Acidimicrobiales bacterium]|nr:S8 family serine peptidase [Acidimicrobiales bacterium]